MCLPAAAAPAEPKPCHLHGVPYEAKCGSLARALDAANAHGTRIELHYAVLPALARQPAPDPIFFIAGGPGQSAIDLAGPVGRMLARVRRHRDIVLVDQRGTGRSAPLRCDDGAARPSLRDQLEAPRQVQRLRECLAQLRKLPHGDLRHFGTTAAMADLDSVRQALGAAQINLVAASYGTRAALEYLRLYPQQVRRVVLDGVVPADMALPEAAATDAQAAFDALLRWCAEDRACNGRYARLAQSWQTLLASLPREVHIADPLIGPMSVPMSGPPSGPAQPLWLSGEAVARLVRSALYLPSTAAALPAAIDAAAQGRFDALLALASALSPAGSRGALAQGMHFAVVCGEDAPLAGSGERKAAAPPGEFDAGLAAMYREVCAFWPHGAAPTGFGRLGTTRSPVLLLSGGIDPATPPRHGERVAQTLGPAARHVVVPHAGHGLLALPCIAEAVHRFVEASDDAQARRVDAGCARELPRPRVFVPPGTGEAP